jgi:hypothetical protein
MAGLAGGPTPARMVHTGTAQRPAKTWIEFEAADLLILTLLASPE